MRHTGQCSRRIGDELEKQGDERLEHDKWRLFDYSEGEEAKQKITRVVAKTGAQGESTNAQASDVQTNASTTAEESSSSSSGAAIFCQRVQAHRRHVDA